jgi:gas vesicle protein
MNRREAFKYIAGSIGILFLSPKSFAENTEVSSETLEKWKSMTPQQRENFREKYRKFKTLNPEQKEKLIRNSKRFANLTPMERFKVISNHKRFEQMTPEQRERIRERYQKFKNLSPEQRQKIRTNVQRRQQQGEGSNMIRPNQKNDNTSTRPFGAEARKTNRR